MIVSSKLPELAVMSDSLSVVARKLEQKIIAKLLRRKQELQTLCSELRDISAVGTASYVSCEEVETPRCLMQLRCVPRQLHIF